MRTKIIWKLINENEYLRSCFSGDANIAMNVAGKLIKDIPENFWKGNKELIKKDSIISSSINMESTLENIGLNPKHYEISKYDFECNVIFKNELTGEELSIPYSDCVIDYVRGDVMFFRRVDKKGKDTIVEEITIGE